MLIVANGFTTRVLARIAQMEPWADVARGEFGETTLKAAAPLIKRKRLWWATTGGLPTEADDVSALPSKQATAADIRKWQGQAAKVTGTGRAGEASAKICEEVEYLAASCCQFEGCGEDLRRHVATGQAGRFTYFAHIVASSSNGPRGDPIRSAQLAGELTNLMLLCDACHRLIDRVNPERYSEQVLRDMRERSIEKVRRLRETLKYKPVEVIAIIGNVGGQPAHFSMSDAEDALWTAELCAARPTPERLFFNGGAQHDPHSAAYRNALFLDLRGAPHLQRLLNGAAAGGAPRPNLGIFAQHGTSVLLMAGRMLGDVAGTHVFQPHRNKQGPLTVSRWAWPSTPTAPSSFSVTTLKKPDALSTEACLIVSLTFPFDLSRLPSTCVVSGTLAIPTLEVAPLVRGTDIIASPADLVEFGRVLDAAIRTLQDEWRVKHVHLFVGAPASATLMVGQKMQARNQATYICHEAVGGVGSAFQSTIEISPSDVRVTSTGKSFSLQP